MSQISTSADEPGDRPSLAQSVVRAIDAAHRGVLRSGAMPVAGACPGTLIVDEILGGIDDYLKTSPPIPPFAYSRTHRKFVRYILDLLEIDRASARSCGFMARLVVGIEQLAKAYYFDSPEVQRRLARGAKDDEERVAADIATILERARDAFGLDDLMLAERLGGGCSGAHVLRVYFRPTGGALKLGVLKCADDAAEIERERNGHAQACSSWMREWVNGEMHRAPVGADRYAVLMPLAFPATRLSQTVPSLAELVTERNRARCEAVVRALACGYAECFKSAHETVISPEQELNRLLQHWDSPRETGAWADCDFWEISAIPAPTVECFQDGRTVGKQLQLVGACRLGVAHRRATRRFERP